MKGSQPPMTTQLRAVFEEVKRGRSLSISLVETLRGTPTGREVARSLLLGVPVGASLEPVLGEGSREVAILAGLLAHSASASTRAVGRRGESLSTVVERWLKAEEARELDRKVMQTRGMLMSAVLGAVVGMLATLGPVVGSLQLTGAVAAYNASMLTEFSAATVGVSAGMLGVFMSGRRFFLNVALAMLVFVVTVSVTSPLAASSASSLGII